MNDTNVDTCHCIVRHPDKAKFLVIKHEESWSPPVLLFPPGEVDFRSGQLNQGMLDKYGLNTRVLRPLMRLVNYHCIEMELASLKSTKNLQAVWVDREEYMRTRTPPGDVPDPFEIWLDEQESGEVHSLRAPFHKPGWFAKADHWIQFQLDSLGIQVTGSLEQFRVGWPSSCLLRIATNLGWIYFKAGYGEPPGEAILLREMADIWPDVVFKPLAIDAERNWLLNIDFFSQGESGRNVQLLPSFAAAMGRMQVQSSKHLDQFQALGCKDQSLEKMIAFCEQPEASFTRLQEGGGGLNEQELSQLKKVFEQWIKECRELADIGLPMALVHPDFRDDNLVKTGDDYRVIDWSDTVIAHPFMVLGRIYRDSRSTQGGGAVSRRVMDIPAELLDGVEKAYLAEFSELAEPVKLDRGLTLAESIYPLWVIMRKLDRLEWAEPKTPNFYHVIVSMQAQAKDAIQRLV